MPGRYLLFAGLVVLMLVMVSSGRVLQAAGDSAGGTSPVRIAVLEFSLLEGAVRSPAPGRDEIDLSRLARALPAGLVGRLLQVDGWETFDLDLLRSRWGDLPLDEDERGIEAAEALLRADLVDQVIVGTVGVVQQTGVVTAQRYTLRNDDMVLLGGLTTQAPRIADATRAVDVMLTDLFRPEEDVVPRSIEQVTLIPSTLRIPVGQTRNVRPLALDGRGQPVPGVQYLFQSNDVSRVQVDGDGNVTGISPGQAVVTMRATGRPSRITPTASTTITVIPPSYGVLIGTYTSAVAPQHIPFTFGLRLTPTVAPRTAPTQAPGDLEAAAANPLSFLTNFFSSLLSEGMLTIDLDVDPGRSLSFTLDAVQRTRSGFFGTGVGFVTPLADGGLQGVNLRLTVGREVASLGSRAQVPVEINADLIFRTGQPDPVARLSISTGLSIFQ